MAMSISTNTSMNMNMTISVSAITSRIKRLQKYMRKVRNGVASSMAIMVYIWTWARVGGIYKEHEIES